MIKIMRSGSKSCTSGGKIHFPFILFYKLQMLKLQTPNFYTRISSEQSIHIMMFLTVIFILNTCIKLNF